MVVSHWSVFLRRAIPTCSDRRSPIRSDRDNDSRGDLPAFKLVPKPDFGRYLVRCLIFRRKQVRAILHGPILILIVLIEPFLDPSSIFYGEDCEHLHWDYLLRNMFPS